MDLVTLIAACALSIEPKIMHALIWEQSGGEPWSFSLPGEREPRVFSKLQDAISEARAVRPDGVRIHVGLTGLSTGPRSATAAMFAPCPNISFAARQITQFAERCKTSPFQADPIYCAIAAYRGSWDRPDTKFADAVRATVDKGNAPNFDMPKDASFDPADLGAQTATHTPHGGSTAPVDTPDDRQRGWSSALFPTKPTKTDGLTADVPKRDRPPEQLRSIGEATADANATRPSVDNLFVPRSTERRP